jgi:hypothetical protein
MKTLKFIDLRSEKGQKLIESMKENKKSNSLTSSQKFRKNNPLLKRQDNIDPRRHDGKLDTRLRYERFKRDVARQKEGMFEDERFSDVLANSMRDVSESIDLTEEEEIEQIDILHFAANQMVGGPKTNSITIKEKREELEMLKL